MEPEKRRKRLNQAIDEQTHRKLKAWAAENGLTLPDALDRLLRQALGLPAPNGNHA